VGKAAEKTDRRGLLGGLVPRFGEIARALGLVRPDDVEEAVRRQGKRGGAARIGDILVEQGKMSDEDVSRVLDEQKEAESAELMSPEEVERFLESRKGRPTLEGLARRIAELERRLVTRGRAEEIAASAALDVLKLYESEVREAVEAGKEMTKVLQRREFARKVAESLPTRVCRRELEEIVADMVHFEFENALDERAKGVFASELETPRFAQKLQEIAGARREVDAASRRLAERLDRIEREALPERLERLFNEKLREKLGDVSAETIAARLDGRALEQQMLQLAQSTVHEIVNTPVFRSMLDDSLFQAAMRDVVNTPQFKSMLDDKFKAMSEYLSREVIPKHVERLKSG
jgi:hypothetical protein